MNPIEFPEQNIVFHPAKGTEDEVGNLPAFRSQPGSMPLIISCWQLSPEDLTKVQETGKIWLTQWQVQLYPVGLSTESPFREINDQEEHYG